MKRIHTETIVVVSMVVMFFAMFIVLTIFSINANDRVSELNDSCFAEANGDAAKKNTCFQISFATNAALSAARRSAFPIYTLMLGIFALNMILLHRLKSDVENLKNR